MFPRILRAGRNKIKLNTLFLKKPSLKLSGHIHSALSNFSEFNGNVDFYVSRKNSKQLPFMGVALRDKMGRPAICFANNIDDYPEDYMLWISKHELRHLMKHPFRGHDILLYDVGFKTPKRFEFFHEDIDEIAASKVLREKIFCNISYTPKRELLINWKDFKWGLVTWLTNA